MKKDRIQVNSAKTMPGGGTQPAKNRARKTNTSTIKAAESKPVDVNLRHSQDETIHANRQLLALSQVAQAVQRANTKEEIFQAIQEQMIQLGYKATVFELDEGKKTLQISHLFYDSRLVRRAEKLVGLSLHSYRIKPRQGGIYHRVLVNGETAFVTDPAQAVRDTLPSSLRPMARPISDLFRLKSCCFAPLMVEGDAIGVLAVTSDDLTEADKPAVTTFANQTAIAMQNTRLYEHAQQEITRRRLVEEELRHRNEELVFLNTINAAINSGKDLNLLYPLIARETARIFNTNGATLHLVDSNRHSLVMQNLSMPPALVQKVEKIIGSSIPRIEHDLAADHPYRSVTESQKPVIINDIHAIEEFTAGFLSAVKISQKTRDRLRKMIPTIVKLLNYRSVLVVPLISGREVIGTLDMGRRELFTDEEAERLELIAGQLTVAIQRKQAEVILRESEERFRKAFFTSPDAININRLSDGLYVSVNQGFTEITGYAREDVLGKTSFELQVWDAPEDRNRLVEELRKKGVVKNFEARFHMKDGRLKHGLMSATIIELGGVPHILNLTRDITDLRNADHALRESEERFRKAFLTSPDAANINRLDDGEFISINQGFTLYTGYSMEDVRGKTPDDLRIFADPDAVDKLLATLEKDGLVTDFETSFRMKDGSIKYGLMSASNIELGGIQHVLFITRDITERKAADLRLRESEEKMRSIFRVAPTGIGMVRDRILLEVNTRICEMTGYSEEELVGKSARMIYPTQEDFDFVGREKYRQIDNKGTGVVETRWKKKDGSIIDILLASTPIDMNDRSKGVTFTALDITERKRSEMSLREAHDRMLLVLDSIPADVYVADLDTFEILYMNQNMRNSFGDNLVGEVCWKAFRQNSGPCPRCTNEKLVDSRGKPMEGVIWEGQNPLTGKWYTNYDRAISWVNGKLVRLEISVDIGERKKAEEELRQHAQELAALQATVLEITTQHDPAALLQSIVERAVRLLNAEGGGLYLCDPVRKEATCKISYNLVRDFTGVVLKYGEGAGGTVAQTGQPLRIDDYRTWSRRAATFEEEQPFRALVSAPMIWQGEVTGVIDVLRSTSENPFTQEDEDLLVLFANHAAIAFENAHLFEQVQRRLRESESLGQASQVLTGSLELQPLLENILETARRAIPAAEKGTIVLKEAEETLRIHAMSGYHDTSLLNLVFKPGEGFVARVFDEQQPLRLDDVRTGFRLPYSGQSEEMKGVLSAICAPLTVKGEKIGVISLDNSSRTAAFTNDDLQLMVGFASSAAVAIHNARLFDQTRRRAGLLTALHEVSEKVGPLVDIQSIAEMTIPTVEKLLGWTRGSLWLNDAKGYPQMLIHSTTGFEGKARQKELQRLKSLITLPGQGIIGWVLQHGEVIRSGNVLEEPRYLMGAPDVRSELCVPMKQGEKVIGCINFESKSPDAFSAEDEQVLSTLAGEIAGAIERARLFEQTRQRADELGSMAQVSAALRIATTRAQMIPVILNQVTEILKIEDAALLSHDPISGANLIEMACGKWAGSTGLRIAAGEGLGEVIEQHRRPFLSDDIKKDKRFDSISMFSVPEAVAASPLIVQNQYLGALLVGRRPGKGQSVPSPFLPDELRLLSSVADMTANAIHRAYLHEQTVRHAEQMTAVNEIGHMLTETLDLVQVYTRLTGAVQNLIPDVCGVFISLYDKRTQSITCTSAAMDGTFLDVKEIPTLLFDSEGGGYQSQVLRNGEPLIVNGSRAAFLKDPRKTPAEEVRQRPETALYVPMLSKETPIGIIQVQSYKPDSFSPQEVDLLTLVANTAAITIENARLFAETEKRLRYITALHNVDAAISASVDLRVTLSIILENVTKELNVDAAALALMNPFSKTLEYTASRGFRTRIVEGLRIRLGEGLAGQAAIQRRLVSHIEYGHKEPDLFDEEKFAAQFAVPLIAKGQVHGVLQIFHRSTIEPDIDWTNFLNTLAGQAAIAMDNANLFDNLQRSNLELTLAYDATIQGWSQAMELRDKETQGHAERVTELTMRLARQMELNDADTVHLRRGVLLHDIGKMGIPDAILLKPGPLSEEEWEIMRKHPVYAYEMLSSITYLRQALDVPYCHHEKWDGSGYPRGLKEEQIPIAGRIFSVVDVFDALTSDRPYRGAWSRDKALDYIREQSGKHFDPRIVEVFLKLQM